MTTYYQVYDPSNGDVIGTYLHYDTALLNKAEGMSIRYFDSSVWVYNVTKDFGVE